MSCKGKVKKLIDKATLLKTQNEELTASNTELTETVETLTADNETLQNANSELETRVDELTASIKPEQEKSVDITENGTTEVTPDEGKTLSSVTINVAVPSSGGTEELEAIIDNSGVLGSTDGTVTKKVELLTHIADVMKKTKAVNFLNDKTIETINFYIDNIESSLNNAFENTTNLKTMVGINTTKISHIDRTFYGSGIVSIREPFNFSSANSSYFQPFFGAEKLEDVRIVPETIKFGTNLSLCKMLSTESIQSIIDGLATVTTAQTLRLHTDIMVKLTDEQILIIQNKNWNIV